MAKHNDTGAVGEQMAHDFLLHQGYEILHRNKRFGRREVDLVAIHEGGVVFVEVKTRHGVGFGFPEEFVDARKQAFLREAAETFLFDHPHYPTLRFDIVSIVFYQGRQPEIQHFKDAFY